MKTRREIRSLEPEILRSFRDAWRRMERTAAFQELAGLHGLPNEVGQPACPHGTYEFLPWHRLYLVSIENLLEANGFNEGLPYWRWTRGAATEDGFPVAFTELSYELADGTSHPNPLCRGWMEFEAAYSTRNGSLLPEDNEDLKELEDDAYDATQFWSDWGATVPGFANLIEHPHDDLHGYAGGPGGAMSTTARASYDPIFWAHHCYVDQQWATWQSLPTSAPLPADIANANVRHYDQPISSTMDYRQELDYVYDELGPTPTPTPPIELAMTASLPLVDLPIRQRSAIKLPVILGGLRMIDESLKLRVFVDTPDSTSYEPNRSNPHYVRTIQLFGMGGVEGEGMFMGEYTRRADVGDAILRLGVVLQNASISVIAQDGHGNPVDLKELGIVLRISGI